MLRKEVENNTEIGKRVKDIISKGILKTYLLDTYSSRKLKMENAELKDRLTELGDEIKERGL